MRNHFIFGLLDEKGWKPAKKASSAEASSPKMLVKSRISPDNYEFRMVSEEVLDGRMAYTIDIIPKCREQHLFQGQIWIDAEEFALDHLA